jgi:multicomponent Na+:H+ antiporter subunit B
MVAGRGGRVIEDLIARELHWIDVLILTMLAVTAIVIVRMRNLWAAVMLMGIYSFLSACWMLILDAPDVAFTEAAVGVGVSTVLGLATLALTTTKMKIPSPRSGMALIVVLVTGGALFYGSLDMPRFGDPNAPAQTYPTPSYVERTPSDIGIPNVVTAVLGSYRGYDTLGETVVIFTAGLGVLLLLSGRRLKRKPEDQK